MNATTPQVDAHPAPEGLAPDRALALAVSLLQQERLDEAGSMLNAVLEAVPEHPDAMHFLGVLRHIQGDTDAGVALIQRAITAMPGEAGPWNNLGNVLVEAQRLDEAGQAYQRAVAAAGDTAAAAEPYNNLGTLYRKGLNWPASEHACRRAIELRPDYGDAWYNLSLALMGQERVAEGLIANSKAVTLWPRHLQAREQVIRALVLLDERDKAAQLYREWLAEDPENPVARHQLAACLGEAVPARASDAYVTQVFDSFAGSFDAKLEKLDYRAPERVGAALQQALGAPPRALDIVDAGCGTGLCGPFLAPYKRHLIGLDLSVNMLTKAKQRKLYDRLYKVELTAYLADNPDSCDVIVSADTLVYFGPLTSVAEAAFNALRSGGILVFSVEENGDTGSSGPGYRLNPNGRYCHASAYVEACLGQRGFAPVHLNRATLRMERGEPVAGLIVTAFKPPARG